jgi:hypothetical protein
VEEFDRVDCGVETDIEIECPECFSVQELELPFEKTFFMPGNARARRRRRAEGMEELDRSSSSPG